MLHERLSNINISFKPLNKYAIIGINGAGKSSLLDAISGKFTAKALKGQVVFNQHSWLKFSAKKRSKHMAILTQSTQVLFNYSVSDIISMGFHPYALTTKEQYQRLGEICELLSLSKHLEKCFHLLSGGQKQRVHLARVILQIIADKNKTAEKWLLLDEHVTGLDLYQQAKIFEVLNLLLKQYNLGIIMVMHDLNLAAKFCDQMFLIDHGKILKVGNPKEVILDDEFKRAFKISPRYLPQEDAFLFSAS